MSHVDTFKFKHVVLMVSPMQMEASQKGYMMSVSSTHCVNRLLGTCSGLVISLKLNGPQENCQCQEVKIISFLSRQKQ